MPEYLLLLNESTTAGPELSAQEIQEIIQEYAAWRDDLEARDKVVHSRKLADRPGRRLAPEGDEVRVLDGPFSEAKEVVAGYFVIRASDDAEAEALARECPHIRHGGSIDVLPVDMIHEGDDAGGG